MSLLRIGQLTTEQSKLNIGNEFYIFTGATFDDGKVEPGKSYVEITSNKNWMSIGLRKYDYLFCRNQVMMWTAVNGWGSLTTEEKEVASRHFAVGQTERDEIRLQPPSETCRTLYEGRKGTAYRNFKWKTGLHKLLRCS